MDLVNVCGFYYGFARFSGVFGGVPFILFVICGLSKSKINTVQALLLQFLSCFCLRTVVSMGRHRILYHEAF